jgi:hypothetical protein
MASTIIITLQRTTPRKVTGALYSIRTISRGNNGVQRSTETIPVTLPKINIEQKLNRIPSIKTT